MSLAASDVDRAEGVREEGAEEIEEAVVAVDTEIEVGEERLGCGGTSVASVALNICTNHRQRS